MRVRANRETVRNYSRALRLLFGMFRHQWFSRERLARLQSKRLRRLIYHAYEKVPYYRALLDEAGTRPEEIGSLADLGRIPVTTKKDLRHLPWSQITARGIELGACETRRTSGSSGEPFTIYWDDPSLTVFYSASVRAHSFIGSRLTDRILLIGPTYYPEDLLVQRLGLGRVKILSPFLGPEEHVAKINSHMPDLLFCYPSVLKGILTYARKQDLQLHRPRIILTSGEYLDPRTTGEIVEAFKVAPCQFYGSWEMGRIGSTCERRNGLHINEDIIIPEFIPVEGGTNRLAYRLVMTNLFNFAMPFIRYDQGDLVEPLLEKCGCGRSFVRIRFLDSRQSDVVYLPDGNTVSTLHLTGIIFELPGIERFKIIQESLDRMVIRIIATDGYSEGATGEALRKVASLLPGVQPVLEQVHDIERDASGKYRQFQSKLGS